MTNRNLSVADAIKKVFKKKDNFDYNVLLDNVKELYEIENTTVKEDGKEEPLIFTTKDTAEFNDRLKDFIEKKQIGCNFGFDFKFSDYTSFKTNIPKEKVICNLFWIDNSVHCIIVNKIMKVIKDDFDRNIIKITVANNTKEYNFSEIEVKNNNANTFYIHFYEFRLKYKDDALKKFNKESTFNYDIPYQFWDKDKINKKYNLTVDCDIKAYMFYPADSEHNWCANHPFDCIKVFVRINNYYIWFEIKEDRIDYIIKLINKIIPEISKK